MLICRRAEGGGARSEIRIFSAPGRRRANEVVIIEISGQEENRSVHHLMRPFGIIELVRTDESPGLRSVRRSANNHHDSDDQPSLASRSEAAATPPHSTFRVVYHACQNYYDKDADLALLKGKTIAILGYGSQGHAHAQNLRDSGCNVIVAELAGTPNYELAVKDKFEPLSTADAVKKADVLTILLPDEIQADVFRTQIRDNLKPGATIVCSHGFNVHFGQFDVPKGVAVVLVAPKARPPGPFRVCPRAGALLDRSWATTPAKTPASWPGLRQGDRRHSGGRDRDNLCRRDRDRPVRRTSRALRRRRRVGQGGLRNARRSGLPAEMAYFECMHELKLIVDLFYQGGLNYAHSVSNTAEYGDYTRGPR